jgi:uncharacterized low-complexity protein
MMHLRFAACSLALALAAAPLQANAHPSSFNLNGVDSSAAVKVHCGYDGDCWHSRWHSHHRWGSCGEGCGWRPRRCDWDPDWGWHHCGWHSRHWSHNRWGSYRSYERYYGPDY